MFNVARNKDTGISFNNSNSLCISTNYRNKQSAPSLDYVATTTSVHIRKSWVRNKSIHSWTTTIIFTSYHEARVLKQQKLTLLQQTLVSAHNKSSFSSNNERLSVDRFRSRSVCVCRQMGLLQQPVCVFLNPVQTIHHELSLSGNENQLPITHGDPMHHQSIDRSIDTLLFAVATSRPRPPHSGHF